MSSPIVVDLHQEHLPIHCATELRRILIDAAGFSLHGIQSALLNPAGHFLVDTQRTPKNPKEHARQLGASHFFGFVGWRKEVIIKYIVWLRASALLFWWKKSLKRLTLTITAHSPPGLSKKKKLEGSPMMVGCTHFQRMAD